MDPLCFHTTSLMKANMIYYFKTPTRSNTQVLPPQFCLSPTSVLHKRMVNKYYRPNTRDDKGLHFSKETEVGAWSWASLTWEPGFA